MTHVFCCCCLIEGSERQGLSPTLEHVQDAAIQPSIHLHTTDDRVGKQQSLFEEESPTLLQAV